MITVKGLQQLLNNCCESFTKKLNTVIDNFIHYFCCCFKAKTFPPVHISISNSRESSREQSDEGKNRGKVSGEQSSKNESKSKSGDDDKSEDDDDRDNKEEIFYPEPTTHRPLGSPSVSSLITPKQSNPPTPYLPGFVTDHSASSSPDLLALTIQVEDPRIEKHQKSLQARIQNIQEETDDDENKEKEGAPISLTFHAPFSSSIMTPHNTPHSIGARPTSVVVSMLHLHESNTASSSPVPPQKLRPSKRQLELSKLQRVELNKQQDSPRYLKMNPTLNERNATSLPQYGIPHGIPHLRLSNHLEAMGLEDRWEREINKQENEDPPAIRAKV